MAAVARRLGVAPATLRTWDRRYGLGPSDHTSGRHRRYGPADIARLEQMQRALLRGASPAEAARYARTVAAPPPQRYPEAAEQASADGSGDGPVLLSGVLDGETELKLVGGTNTGGRGLRLPGAGPRTRGLGRAALALDSWSVQRLLIESMNSDGVVRTWNEMLQPVLRAVHERRQRSGSGVEVLQMLVDCASTALRSVIANAPEPRNPRPVVLAPVPGEAQELELVALAAALAVNRVDHRLFGAALPREGLAAAVRRSAPAAVVLWADQSHYASPRVLEGIPITRQRARAFVAGAGWAQQTLPAHVEQLDSLEVAVARVSETVLG
ncbi:MerR family transcriptional regulator [Saccharopolyspora subtropica]|uniref:MerR family transcriptional regulator n=1 Tax=Saccharopolyspora thermophila TaxID=89367 RepID=A0A917JP12_9PSEU|nr:MerR family transcriptional regulator [Saccharopolyspora subtropica]